MILGQETLGFRRAGSSPALSLLTPAFSLPSAPRSLTLPLRRTWNAPLPFAYANLRLRRHASAPLYLRRRRTRPVSYYAFFKGWLLLSQPPGCLGSPTSLTT